ncbi:MAG: LacI family transcriptional regulator [Opitutaceae bacterium]|jgi:DNA-binding LacI/PurR family transcriptional regulator|nr:LacI family transcriptional regulator [Opitutaceae bacterium]
MKQAGKDAGAGVGADAGPGLGAGAVDPSSGGDGQRRRRVTLADVARKAGVSIPAVSMALRNHPGIGAETRERIRKIAQQLGYRPDPLLASLAAYRSSLRPAHYRGTLAWLINSTDGYKWDMVPHHAQFFDGAREAADRHGFQLEKFDLAREGKPCFANTVSILRARGIAGILVSPQPFAQTDLTDFPWADFPAVEMARTLGAPRLHGVVSAHFRATAECIRRLRETGHRRIGFVASTEEVLRNEHLFLGAWFALRETTGADSAGGSGRSGRVGGSGQIPPLMGDQPDLGPLCDWLRKYRPDSIVGGHWLAHYLQKAGWRVPEDTSVVCPNLPDDLDEITGMWEVPHVTGAAAANFLVSLIHRGERGIPGFPQTILVDGRWQEGRTLLAR